MTIHWKVRPDWLYLVQSSSNLRHWNNVSIHESDPAGGLSHEASTGRNTFYRLLEMPSQYVMEGDWQGTKTTVQAGACSVMGSGNSRKEERVEFHIDARQDGFRVLQRIDFGDFSAFGEVMSGTADVEGILSAETHARNINCFGSNRQNVTFDYEGLYTKANGEESIALTAREVWCPVQNCVFDVTIELQRASSSP